MRNEDLAIFMTNDGNEFAFNKRNELFINGRKVMTEKIVSLRIYELILATVGSVSALVIAATSIVKLFC